MSRHSRPGARAGGADDRGAASVVALGLVGAIIGLTALVVPVLGAFVGSQRAANAADAAALAAADASSGAVPGVPCALASAIAERNGVELVSCGLEGPVSTVSVRVGVLGFDVSAEARAGPPGWPG
ncbi:Rv3654c family TadE-like protein [Agromyces lapidis]|uniref:Rv3654c family TadE-like protein n=1 Tax=Agromyces lapidis TaxID=279574 RepID=A0ABV5SRM4_9MICO|nr:Rv3654c family TadE-like protein [Agromyces lapidis]